jgi:hypothetical protein
MSFKTTGGKLAYEPRREENGYNTVTAEGTDTIHTENTEAKKMNIGPSDNLDDIRNPGYLTVDLGDHHAVIKATTAEPKTLEDGFDTVISAYTRAQALDDGELVDVTEEAKKAGFKYPVAVTRALFETLQNRPKWEDFSGRLWDVFQLLHVAIKRADEPADIITFNVILNTAADDPDKGRSTTRTIRAICGPDDNGAPCITIMHEWED